MRILYACRLFSGLETSVLRKRWEPTGVPAIYKMIESLDRGGCTPRFLLACKDGSDNVRSHWTERRDRTLSLEGLSHPVTVLAGIDRFPSWLGKSRQYLREIRQIWRLWREIRHFQPDIVYLDHANIWAAGLLSRLLPRRVVLRVMGVYPVMRRPLTGHLFADRVLRWAYRGPYALAICTEDGSGGEKWLEDALARGVERTIMINGVAVEAGESKAVTSPSAAPMKVLFVGKLEMPKGCGEFFDAVIALNQRRPGHVQAMMVGTGTQSEILRRKASAAGAHWISFIDRLPHRDVAQAMRDADIYVSLNKLGNLSNANLEAMAAGACMVILESQPAIGVDTVTDRLVPPDAVMRVALGGLPQSLTNALEQLLDHPEKRRAMREKLRAATSRFLTDWDGRIAAERALLARIAAGEDRLFNSLPSPQSQR